MEVQPGGDSDRPDTAPDAQEVLFVVEGEVTLIVNGTPHLLDTGG
jgi:(S)-ureidoglycine aminohydrolase